MKDAKPEDAVSAFLPLSPAVLHILMALAGEERHGYGIMQEVLHESGGRYKLGPGTLYDNLQKLMDQGLVDEAARKLRDDDPRRRYYKLSALGKRVITAEITRLEKSLASAKLRLAARPGRA